MEGITEGLPRGNNAQIIKTMLDLLTKKRITLDEYLKRCAHWGIETLDDLYFRSLPSKSLEIIEYEQLSYYRRQKLTQEFFADHPGIMRYYDQKRWVEIQNKTSLFKLKDIKKYLPESDTANHNKVDKKIMDFKIKMES